MNNTFLTNYSNFVNSTLLTSQYEDDRELLSYLLLGLSSEIGEVFSVYKKFIRKDYDYDAFKKRLVDEFGDVIWYSFAILNYLNYVPNDQILFYNVRVPEYNNLVEISKISHNIFSYYILVNISDNPKSSINFNSSTIIKYIIGLLQHISSILNNHNTSLIDSINHNINKISSRYKNNKIQGDGDYR